MTTDKVPNFSDPEWLEKHENLKNSGLYSIVELVAERLDSILAGAANFLACARDEKFYTWEEALAVSNQKQRTGITNGGNQLAPDWRPKIVVGTSGGADSVALLLICAILARQDDSPFDIVCAHVNHRMRSQASDDDALFCSALAQSLKVSFKQIVATDDQMESFLAGGSERDLRDFRYSALAAIAREVGSQHIVLAHTLNDQVETYLFRTFRGSALNGLRGIPCIRHHNDALIVRPIIDLTREQLVQVLRTLGISWREDVSNQNLKYARNYIRNEITPRIFSRFEDFTKSIERTRQLIAEDESFLQSLCDQVLTDIEGTNKNLWNLSKFNLQPLSLRRRLFAHALNSRGIEVSFDRVEKMLGISGSHGSGESLSRGRQTLSLNENWELICEGDKLFYFERTSEARDFSDENGGGHAMQPITVKNPGMTIIAALNKCLFIQVAESNLLKGRNFPAADAMEAFVSLDHVNGPLHFREREADDFIQPFGMKEHVKLKKYLHTHKTVSENDPFGLEKRKVTLLACGQEVLWIPGIGLSEKLRVSSKPSHVLKLLDIAVDQVTFA